MNSRSSCQAILYCHLLALGYSLARRLSLLSCRKLLIVGGGFYDDEYEEIEQIVGDTRPGELAWFRTDRSKSSERPLNAEELLARVKGALDGWMVGGYQQGEEHYF